MSWNTTFWGSNVNTQTDPWWSEASRLISGVQGGTQPGLKQKSQAIYQAADADSLNSLAQKRLQTRPLLQEKIAQLDLWLEFGYLWCISYLLLSFLIFPAFSSLFSLCLKIIFFLNNSLWVSKWGLVWTTLFLFWSSITKEFYSMLYLYLCLRYSGPSYLWLQLRKQNRPHQLWAVATNMLHIYSLPFFFFCFAAMVKRK